MKCIRPTNRSPERAVVAVIAQAAALATMAVTTVSAQQGESSDGPDWGIRTLVFPTEGGEVRVVLPDDAAAGDRISGTVSSQPAGDSEEERAKNLRLLAGFDFPGAILDGTVASGRVEIEVPGEADHLELALETSDGETIVRALDIRRRPCSTEYDESGILTMSSPYTDRSVRFEYGGDVRRLEEIEAPTPPREAQPPGDYPARTCPYDYDGGEFSLPRIVQTGRPIVVAGPFDGILLNTELWLEQKGNELGLVKLAESPRQTVFSYRGQASSRAGLTVRDGGREASGPINLLSVSLSAPKLDLTRGERTTVTARVEGLRGLDRDQFPVPFRMVNESPAVVTFSELPGKSLRQLIPSDAAEEGAFTFSTVVLARQTGSFSITAWVPWWLGPEGLEPLWELEELLEQPRRGEPTCTVEIQTETFKEPPEALLCPDCESFRGSRRWAIFAADGSPFGGSYRWVLKRPPDDAWVRLANADRQRVEVDFKDVSHRPEDVELGVIYTTGQQKCADLYRFTVQQPALRSARAAMLWVEGGLYRSETGKPTPKKSKRFAGALADRFADFSDPPSSDALHFEEYAETIGDGLAYLLALELRDQFGRAIEPSAATCRIAGGPDLRSRTLEQHLRTTTGVETDSREMSHGRWVRDLVTWREEGVAPKELFTLWRGLGCCLRFEHLSDAGRGTVPDLTVLDSGGGNDAAVCEAFKAH